MEKSSHSAVFFSPSDDSEAYELWQTYNMPLSYEKRIALIESLFSSKEEFPILILAMREWQRYFSMEQIKLSMIQIKITSFERHIQACSSEASIYQKKMGARAKYELSQVMEQAELLISRYRKSVGKYQDTVTIIQHFSKKYEVDYSLHFAFLNQPILDILDESAIEDHLQKIGF